MTQLTYDYYPAILYAIDLISQGKTRTTACDEANITIAVFENYTKGDKQLQDLLVEAETRGYDAMCDLLMSIDNHKTMGRSDAKMAKVISDNIKWILERRRPKQFGARLDVNHTITADRAILDALSAARSRTTVHALTDQSIPDADFIDVTPDEDAALLQELLS